MACLTHSSLLTVMTGVHAEMPAMAWLFPVIAFAKHHLLLISLSIQSHTLFVFLLKMRDISLVQTITF